MHQPMEKRINDLPTPDEVHKKCACNHNNTKLQEDILALTSQYCKLESKFCEEKLARLQLNDDTERLKERLDVLEALVRRTGDNSGLCSNNKQGFVEDPNKRDSVSNAGIKSNTKSETQDSIGDVFRDIDNNKYTKDSARDNDNARTNSKREVNFLNDEVDIVKQDVKRVYDGDRHWRYMAKSEQRRNHELYKNLEDIHVVICVDISESMAECNGWVKAHTFLTDYLTGLENMSKFHYFTPEQISVVIFGHETKVLVEYTNRYEEIRKKIDEIKLGGPSQMFGGVLFAEAMAFCTKAQLAQFPNQAIILTKIIIITDGRVTEADLIAGPDVHDSSKIDETKAKILQEMEGFRRSQRDVFFVPVGNLDLDFINTMAACCDGMLLDHTYGTRFSRRQFLTKQLADPFGIMTDELTHGSDHKLSKEDMKDMRNIQERFKHHIEEHAEIVVDCVHMYEEKTSTTLPEIGCRVRRGPNWKYNNQDGNGPGTVIGHDGDDNHVWCEWDNNGLKKTYHYGPRAYSVLVVDEPRILKPGEVIAVGCQVVPGKDWKNSEGNVDNGVVIKLDKRANSVLVRWNNGRRGIYSFGTDGKQEVRLKTNTLTRSDNEQRPPCKLHSSEEWEMPRAIRPPRKLPSSEEWEMPRAIRPPRKLPSYEEWEMPRAIRPPRKLSTSEEWEMPRAMTIEEFEIKQNKNKNKKKNKNI